MIPSLRQQRLMDLLVERGRVCFLEDIVREMKVSESTVRRDLKTLEKQGHLRMLRGGGVCLRQDHVEMGIGAKLALHRPAKEKIARYAASLVREEDVIYLDPSSICWLMIDYLKGRRITVITNSVAHMARLMQQETPAIMIGGQAKAATNACVGGMAEEMLKGLWMNKCFLGAGGLTPEMGLTNHDPSECAVKRLAIQQSQETYFLVNTAKVGVTTMCRLAEIDRYPIVMEEAMPSLSEYKNILIVSDEY